MSLRRASIVGQLRQLRVDDCLALCCALPPLGLIALALHGSHWLLAAGALISAAAITQRHRAPLAALALALAVALVWPSDKPLLPPVLLMVYAIASSEGWRRTLAVASGTAAAMVLAAVLWGHAAQGDRGGPFGYPVALLAAVAAATAAGLYLGAHGRMVEALRERAEKLQREQELLAERSVAQERMRIAHEIHDVVAHNVSLMVLKAQVLGLESDDQHVRQATRELADLGRTAIGEMHATVRLLRGDEAAAPLAPQPGLSQLDQLVTQAQTAGMQVQLTVEGAHQPLPQAVDLCAYRIIQEALTNVRKHDPEAQTSVWLSYQPRALQIDVTDRRTAEPGKPRTLAPVGGHGLIGMRERAELFGGTLTTTMLTDGFTVTASLPYRTGAQ